MIKRLLIANRGEIAVRIIRACRELGIESVAVYSDADAERAARLAADRAVAIGPAPAAESYLSIPGIIDAAAVGRRRRDSSRLRVSVRERALCARRARRRASSSSGRRAGVIARMGSKIEARRLAAAAGVPVVPGETPDDQSDRGVAAAIERVGLPALVKASAGGGGKGMRRVTRRGRHRRGDPGGAPRGGGRVRRRHALRRAADRRGRVTSRCRSSRTTHGHVVHLFERECSVQRRHQKVIEESPSPALTPALRARMTDGRGRGGARRRLPQCRHDRVPRRWWRRSTSSR